nr:hypothetical protein [Tanacetum cinerariifolium]
MVDFTMYLCHDCVFVQNPLQYLQGEQRVINDINFEGMVFDELYPIIRSFVLQALVTMFYKIRGHPLNVGLKPLASDEDVIQFVTTCFENRNEIDLYTKHNGYDVMDRIHNEVLLHDEVTESEHSDDEIDKLGDVQDIVDFQTEGEEHVNIKKLTTDDPWLNKLVGLGNFIGHCDDPTPDLTGRFMEEVDDPDENIVEYKNKVKKDLLVYYGRDVSQGKCARKRGKKPIKKPSESDIEKEQTSSGKKKQFVKGESSKTSGKGSESSKTSGKGSEHSMKTCLRWIKKRILEMKKLEKTDHKCRRNFNLGALVTYKWIAQQLGREVIDNPCISFKAMWSSIMEKYLIDVSLGQCARAKKLALFDHEGGLIDHYSRLWQYRQAVLDSNPGSTCHIDLEDRDGNGVLYFKRFYFISLLQEDLDLDEGKGLTIISDGHKLAT